MSIGTPRIIQVYGHKVVRNNSFKLVASNIEEYRSHITFYYATSNKKHVEIWEPVFLVYTDIPSRIASLGGVLI